MKRFIAALLSLCLLLCIPQQAYAYESIYDEENEYGMYASDEFMLSLLDVAYYQSYVEGYGFVYEDGNDNKLVFPDTYCNSYMKVYFGTGDDLYEYVITSYAYPPKDIIDGEYHEDIVWLLGVDSEAFYSGTETFNQIELYIVSDEEGTMLIYQGYPYATGPMEGLVFTFYPYTQFIM